MKHLLLTTIAAVVLVGCGESQQSATAPETKPVEPVAEAAQPETPTTKASDISIRDAAYNGNIETVKQAIAAGADVNEKDNIGLTPLHSAARKGHKEIIELLIAAGADVNAKDKIDGYVPLHLAATKGHKEVVELLIVKGADVNAKDTGGKTPLDWAIGFQRFEIADLLRKHGGKTGEELKVEGK
jgi:ankyrin repeat protein